MNRMISLKTAVVTASVSVFAVFPPAFAQDGAEEKPAGEEVVAPAKPQKAFHQLLRCVRAVGGVQVLKPRAEGWVDAVEGRYYPLGSSVRAVAGAEAPQAGFAFGEKARVTLKGAAEFATREAPIGEQARVVDLRAGRVAFNLPAQLGAGMFKVVAPAFVCEDLAGESVFDYAAAADGDEVVVRCVTGRFRLTGSHYVFPEMLAANQVRIRTTGDRFFTSIRGESGVCKLTLDQGLGTEKNFETGETKDVAKKLDFQLSPQCSVKIFRAKSAVGGRVSVSTMTFSPAGTMLNRVAFSEGRSNVNTGELVIPEKIPEGDKAKKLEDDSEEEVVEGAPAEKKEEADEEKKEETAKDDEEL